MQSLTVKQLEVVKALSSGLSATTAADVAGLHRTTIHHWCRTIPEFRDALEVAKQARIDIVYDEMNALVSPSIDILRHIIEDESVSPALRIRTALAILKFVATPAKSATRKQQDPEAEIHHNSSPEEQVEESAEAQPPQTPRNATCPCGSQLKYKRCCGRNAPPVLSQAA